MSKTVVSAAPLMRSPVRALHAAAGAEFESRGAWEVAAVYGSGEGEREALASGLGFADVSARGKVQLTGAVETMIGMVAGARVARFARDSALVLGPPSTEAAVLRSLEGAQSDAAMATDMTSAYAGFLVAGPRLADFVARAMTIDPDDLQPGRCMATAWAHIPAVVVVLDVPSPAVELYVSSDYGRYAWRSIAELGSRLGARPVGWRILEDSGWK